ncbi:nucleotide exchange factor GrpE [Inquilinus sp. Marseille-Q2685]|uniref:nucleotide exchange factor GrpE n=1 Tax=Inquilinus sp. Marseille-Q2685 TaxID=2866581 RepID=UPI001CE4A658|nr:nucleotide exchange factor GrpE [Inquilinus sp. Marseille-Q2685]
MMHSKTMSAEPRPDATEPETGAAGPEVEGVAETETAAEAAQASDPGGDAALAGAAERIAALEAENAKLKDQALRALAETENIRRRSEREREDTAKYAISGFAKSLLDAADNLRRAIDAVPAEAVDADPALKTLVDGVAATERQLLAAFERHGVTRIEPVGETFDPNFHQAMFELPGTGKPSGTIVQVVQPGYVLQGRLLRPAMVGVAKGE